jgi:hypothetical protein
VPVHLSFSLSFTQRSARARMVLWSMWRSAMEECEQHERCNHLTSDAAADPSPTSNHCPRHPFSNLSWPLERIHIHRPPPLRSIDTPQEASTTDKWMCPRVSVTRGKLIHAKFSIRGRYRVWIQIWNISYRYGCIERVSMDSLSIVIFTPVWQIRWSDFCRDRR